MDVAALAQEMLAPVAVDVFGQATPKCGLGHENAAGARFCNTCGLPMDAPPPPGRDPVAEGLPKPVSQLTADEAAERAQQHAEVQAALARAEQAVPDISAQPDPSDKKLLIHFVEDGFTWAGRVWNQGDELEIGPEHPRWQSAVGWITLDKVAQVNRYGRVFFEPGPWPYKQIPPGTEFMLPEMTPQKLQAMRRGHAVPSAGAGDMPGSLVPR